MGLSLELPGTVDRADSRDERRALQFLQFLGLFAGAFAVIVAALLVGPRDRGRSGSARPPTYRARHDPRRPALPLRPDPRSERGQMALWGDRHPGWSLTGAEGLAREEVEARPEQAEAEDGQR